MEVSDDYNSLLLVRTCQGVATALLFQTIPLVVYVGVFSADIFQPLMSIYKILKAPLTIRNWFLLFPVLFSMILAAASLVFASFYKSKSVESRFQLLQGVLNIPSLLRFIAYFLFTLLVPLSYLNIGGFSLTYSCSDYKELKCLNSDFTFVFTCCIWVGLYYIIRNEMRYKPMTFPIIPQPKLSKIRFELVRTLQNSFRIILVPIIYFIIFSYFFGAPINTFLGRIYSVRSENYSLPLFKASTMFCAWVTSALTYYSLASLRKCLSVYLTYPHSFTTSALLKALATPHSLIKSLAFYDLNLISAGRRGDFTEIYSLSQPGGIPHKWNSILMEYEKIVHEFLSEIEFVNGGKPPVSKNETDKVPIPPISMNSRIRRLVTKEWSQPVAQVSSQPTRFEAATEKIVSRVSDLPPVRFLFSPVPEIKLSTLLEDSQKVIWAIESVSNLTAGAFTEDKFGVVVNNVANIVTMLLQLVHHLGGQRKVRQRDRTARMRIAILSAARRGLTKIAVAYSDHLDHLNLPPEGVQMLKSYAAMQIY